MSGTKSIVKCAPFVKMKSKNVVLVCSLILLLLGLFIPSLGLNIRNRLLRLRVLEFDRESGRLVQVLTSQNSDLIVGEGINSENSVILECRSTSGPIAFSYEGDGMPEFSTTSNYTKARQIPTFWEFLNFSKMLKAEDTGNYTCTSMIDPTQSNSIYLFVPDSTGVVFVPSRAASRLEFSRRDGSIRIPCNTVHPDASVSLERIVDGRVRRQTFESVTFNPKTGFNVPMAMVYPGQVVTFLCRGSLQGKVEESRYKLVSEESLAGFPEQVISQGTNVKGLISTCTNSTCGPYAECIVIEYNPYCVCFAGYTGIAKQGCRKIYDEFEQYSSVRDPCGPTNTCGPFSQCLAVNGHPVCTCKENHYGSPPNCKPQKSLRCSTNNDCEWDQYCNQQIRLCDKVCEGKIKFCGDNSRCFVINHTPFCECLNSFKGNPYMSKGNKGCKPSSEVSGPVCGSSNCGTNALCEMHPYFSGPMCVCPRGHTGDPRSICVRIQPPTKVPEIDSPSSESDIERRLCSYTVCGRNAKCRLRGKGNRNDVQCYCEKGYRGDPYVKCTSTADPMEHEIKVCNACGPNSICKISNGQVFCECAPDTRGFPPNCRRQVKNICNDDFDCLDNQVCQRNKCLNPCSWMCSETAVCEVFNHVAKCKCPEGLEGDPHFSCKKPAPEIRNHPCQLNCGPNTICRAVPYEEIEQYRNSPRTGKNEAFFFDIVRANANLQSGVYSECLCRKNFKGNPYSVAGCEQIKDEESQFPTTIVMITDPCKPKSPCGPNSICRGFNGRAFCSCDSSSAGQPPNCRLRCQADKDCLFNETCITGLCEDP